MVQIVRQKMTRHDDARSLMRAIYNTEVDLVPDPQAKTLTIRLHPLANASSDDAVQASLRRDQRHRNHFSGYRLAVQLRIGILPKSLTWDGDQVF